MKSELWYLTLVTALTGLLFLPYVLDRVLTWGLTDTVGYPAHPKPQSPWAQRLMRAHANAVENLVVFATLVLVAQVAGVSNGATATACMVYFWARVVHVIAYALAMPWIRTLGFFVGFLCQATIAWQILAH
jgi:uncharacterized MAPEG superfamily protein